jgi:hypothetical protein|tara:strand:- start:72 stop:305 length:234 start_codon:yes stop_codon:yes gene_type:complete
MEDLIVPLLFANFILLFIAYIITQIALRNLNFRINSLSHNQQSTVFGVSHVWGSVKELREFLEEFCKGQDEEDDEDE